VRNKRLSQAKTTKKNNKYTITKHMKNIYKTVTSAVALGLLVLMTGCSSMPSVNVWEKADLAKPAMTFESDVLDAKFTDHIYFSREAASGGSGVGGGGCGCN
jgi:Domain of unknown function (DUF4266)